MPLQTNEPTTLYDRVAQELESNGFDERLKEFLATEAVALLQFNTADVDNEAERDAVRNDIGYCYSRYIISKFTN